MSFLAEIRRRKVFQVAAVYAVVAWLAIQIVDVVGEPLNLPDWFDTFTIVLFALGFPIAVILAWAFDLTPDGVEVTSEDSAAGLGVGATATRFGYVSQALILIAVGFLVIDQYLLQDGDIPVLGANNAISGLHRLTMNLGAAELLSNTEVQAHLALSPDGERLVFAAQRDGVGYLYRRDMDRLDWELIPGTEGAHNPFFSPDGQTVGFFSDTSDKKLKTVPAAGGPVRTLADAPFSPGASWSDVNFIVYSVRDERGLLKISADGGAAEQISVPESGTWHVWPEMLPGSNGVLFTVRPQGGSSSEGTIVALSLDDGVQRTVVENAYKPSYSPTGHVLFMRGSSLWAIPFDSERLRAVGSEVELISDVQTNLFIGAAAYTLSASGTLMYLPAQSVGFDVASGVTNRFLVWVDQRGNEEQLPIEPQRFASPRISPDGERLAASVIDDFNNKDIWVFDIARNTRTRLTIDPGDDNMPTWTSEGDRIAFNSARDPDGIYVKAADGSGQVEHVISIDGRNVYPEWFSPDGVSMLFRRGYTQFSDLLIATLDDPSSYDELIATEHDDDLGTISPNGRWLAYNSDESGRYEVYVRPFPAVQDGGPWQISLSGGREPVWSRDGDKLYFRSGSDVFSVSVSEEIGFRQGSPTLLFSGDYFFEPDVRSYDIGTDGRFLMLRGLEQFGSAIVQPVVLENWFSELNAMSPRLGSD